VQKQNMLLHEAMLSNRKRCFFTLPMRGF